MAAEIRDDLASGHGTNPQGKYQQARALQGKEGAQLVVEVVSDAFNPILAVEGPGLGTPLYHAAEPGTCRARIAWTVPRTGTYRVVVAGSVAGLGMVPSLPYVLSATAQPPATGDSACAHLIVPGVRVGPITATTSEAQLRVLAGEDLTEVDVPSPGGAAVPGTALYPDDPLARILIRWTDPGDRSRPECLIIEGQASLWHTARGVRLGTTLNHLDRLNGGPILVGYDVGEQRGSVHSWERGALEGDFSEAEVALGGGRWQDLTPPERDQVQQAAKEWWLDSRSPLVRKLELRVVRMTWCW